MEARVLLAVPRLSLGLHSHYCVRIILCVMCAYAFLYVHTSRSHQRSTLDVLLSGFQFFYWTEMDILAKLSAL